jgi:cell fate (sporulation/competence/biofilm development) regulator YlbF (YheA/YmcA/DUF963 family)
MTNNNDVTADLDNSLEDASGLVEIQQALEEIERLKNEDEEVQPEEDLQEEEEISLVGGEENKDLEDDASKKDPQKLDKIWKIKRSRYKALAEKRAALEENARLKEMLAESLDSGTYHYGKTTHSELEKAKEFKKRAIEEGDVDALIEADMALSRAVNNVNELEKWQSSSAQNSSQVNNEPAPEAHDEIEQAIATDWLDNHTYLQPDSGEYNPELASEVSQFIKHLDGALVKNGQQDAYFSEEYFEEIDKYIVEVNNRIHAGNKNKAQKNAKNLESAAHIGSVRNSYSSSPSSKTPSSRQLILSADEKRMCANAGITEKDWLRYKLEDLKKGK